MSRHRLVDAPRSDALLIAVLVGGVAALGAGAYWAIKATIEGQKSEASAQAKAAPAPRVEPRRPEPEPTPTPEPAAVAAEPVPTPDETEPVVEGGCELDEVACLLEDEPPACCAIYGNRGVPLGKDDIVSAIDSAARRKIMRCQTDPPFEGTVKASVKVSPNGNVASVSVGGDGDPPNELTRCVAGAMKKLKFRKTSEGGSFRYPFAFD